MEKRIARIVSI